jgi:hypothetical protein
VETQQPPACEVQGLLARTSHRRRLISWLRSNGENRPPHESESINVGDKSILNPVNRSSSSLLNHDLLLQTRFRSCTIARAPIVVKQLWPLHLLNVAPVLQCMTGACVVKFTSSGFHLLTRAYAGTETKPRPESSK